MISTEKPDESIPGIPNLDYNLTPITDFTFEKQGWTKVMMHDDISNIFYTDYDLDILLNGDTSTGITKEELDEIMNKNNVVGYTRDELVDQYNSSFINNDNSSNSLESFMDGESDDDDDDDNSYFWILKLPRDLPIDVIDDCPTLISTVSDELIDGLNDGEYVVQLFSPFKLGMCINEEEIEILYQALTGTDIYDF